MSWTRDPGWGVVDRPEEADHGGVLYAADLSTGEILRLEGPTAVIARAALAGHERHLLLLPFAVFLLWATVPYVAESWRIREASVESSGLPFVFVLKTLMPVAAAQLGLQALASATLLGLGGESVVPPHFSI